MTLTAWHWQPYKLNYISAFCADPPHFQKAKSSNFFNTINFEFSGAGKDYEEDDLYDPDDESFEESSDDEWIMEDEG